LKLDSRYHCLPKTNGGSPGARTLDLRIKSPLLYQLS
jgi:hypothetical protein